MKSFMIPFIIVFFISSIFIVLGVWLLSANTDLIENGIKTEGKITAMVRKTDSEGSKMWHPVVEFTTNNGIQFSKEMIFGTSPPAYETGDAVEVLYYVGNPDSAVINSYFQMYVFPWIFIAVGIFIECIMVIVYIIKKRTSRNLTPGTSANNSAADTENESLYDKKADKDKENPFLLD